MQEPEADILLIQRVFKRHFGRPPRLLREDFCGTAAVCCEWVRGRPERSALGVDIDPVPLAWGREHNLARLPETARARVTLRRDDARRVRGTKADIVAAQNFSFQCFTTRPDLKRYFNRITSYNVCYTKLLRSLRRWPAARASCRKTARPARS